MVHVVRVVNGNIGIDLASGTNPLGAEMVSISRMQHLKEAAKVLVPNGFVGVISLTSAETALKLTLLAVSVVYTVLHIMVLWRKLKSKKD